MHLIPLMSRPLVLSLSLSLSLSVFLSWFKFAEHSGDHSRLGHVTVMSRPTVTW